MSSRIFSSSRSLSASLNSKQDTELEKLWNKVKKVNPLLSGLTIDIETSDQSLELIESVKIVKDWITETLQSGLEVSLLQLAEHFFIRLKTEQHMILLRTSLFDQALLKNTEQWKISSTLRNEEPNVDITQSLSQTMKKWPNLLFSYVHTGFHNYNNVIEETREPVAKAGVQNSFLPRPLKRGDIICVRSYKWQNMVTYFHYGVYIGQGDIGGQPADDVVIDLCQGENTEAQIRKRHLFGADEHSFASNVVKEGESPSFVFRITHPDDTDEILEKTARHAEHFCENPETYSKQKYSLTSANCEHFTNFCRFGELCSEQVKDNYNGAYQLLKIIAYISKTQVASGVAEVIESFVPIFRQCPILGEAVTIIILLIEAAYKAYYRWTTMKQIGYSNSETFRCIMKTIVGPMGPELGWTTIFLFISIWSPQFGIWIGVIQLIGSFLLRFLVRPQVERFFEGQEFSRLEQFSALHPPEVARLAMKPDEVLTSESMQKLVREFEKRKLSGKSIADQLSITSKELKAQMQHSEVTKPLQKKALGKILSFLDDERQEIITERICGFIGKIDFNDKDDHQIHLIYDDKSLKIPTNVYDQFTPNQLLQRVELEWQTNFLRKNWQIHVVKKDGDVLLSDWQKDSRIPLEIQYGYDTEITLKITLK